ncbi:hypothetical protein A2160_05255 [Candidatus Beckwithbacteria bacterium RBG_13_42_9]|uniref:UTP--glucose-1-phosphate uridylyltransferase n=1 Tax=Candidatus Beckwithbacteria bacterium RBG_13_42_9 TaxID=1797457 RepID=A0A1F5E6X9_9BACT|nr:MAG: hypothetical protein A2160_05255 [Candidatus Beckwithbacteria bacterium RBG_13_42_9]
MANKITKAVIAVAGYGTRFLPATKNQPKEMLPIIDKPIVQYLVEEAVAAGIKDIILVTRFGQSALENHFDSNMELEMQLEKSGKKKYLEEVQKVYRMANFIYVRQGRHLPYGNGTPLICVRNLIARDESFVYMFGDDLVKSEVPCTKQLINYWKKRKYNVIAAVQEVPEEEVSHYAIYKIKSGTTDRVESGIEKPNPRQVAKPYLAQFGRFILNKGIIDVLNNNYMRKRLGKDNELWLTDAIIEYAQIKPVYAAKIDGKWMTTGDPLHYIKTMVEYALDRPDLGNDFREYLKSLNL